MKNIDVKKLQSEIAELEKQGWTYHQNYRMNTFMDNESVEMIALTKIDKYRMIKNGKIYPEKSL